MTETVYRRRAAKTRMERLHSKKKKSKIPLLFMTAVFAAVCGYTGGIFFFQNHFFKNTTINNVDVSYMDSSEAFSKIKSKSLSYDIKIKGRNNLNDTIKAYDIGLKLNDNAKEEVAKLKSGQKSYLWVTCLFRQNSYYNYNILDMNEDKFQDCYSNLKVVKNKNITVPKEPFYKYNGSEFVLQPEIKGNTIIEKNLKKNIRNGILSGKHYIILNGTDSYKNPKFSKEDKAVAEAKDVVNQFKDLKLTYVFDDGKKTIDGSTIENWFSYNDKFKVSIDKNKINEFVNNISSEYGCNDDNSRNFKTSDNRNITIYGGDYKNVINKEAEISAILNMLNSKKSEERTPIYKHKELITGRYSVGNTYVEIDLTNQHLWYYKNSSLIVEGDIVSGNVSQGNGTPQGVYRLKGKQANAVLVGDNYRTAVSYWMPFNGGIGIHDANWRSVFGGEIYYRGGSHGCVNAPYNLAQTIFNNIETGTPIVCYY